MESEDVILETITSGDCSENNELLKSGLEPGGVVTQDSNFDGEVDSFRFSERDNRIKTSSCDQDLSDHNIRTEKHMTSLENFEVNEDVMKIMGLPESNNEIEGEAEYNSEVDAVGALPESRTVPDSLVHDQGDVRNEDGKFPMEREVEMDVVDSPVRKVNIEVADSAIVSENLSCFGLRVNSQNHYLDSQNDIPLHNCEHCGSVSGVKRARIAYDGKHPSVHVKYNSLTRASKRKLEELLLQWSEWHAQHRSSSQDSNKVLESGEETYFPALWVDMEKSSSMSFWIENQTKKEQSSDLPQESASMPLYDRGFAFGLTSADAPSNVEGGLEIVGEATRCFNCGSYRHSLKECPKPRDNVAVNHARKQHKSKRNQNAGSCIATRYYQNSSGGKYDGLKPGYLDAETRQVLCLGELDPPPWLNRMRELGYPPGYLVTDDEDQPSGITIFANEDAKGEQKDGEVLETEPIEPTKKMAVEFPGVNAPIPENADERAWAPGHLSYDSYRKRSHHRSDYSSESISRQHHLVHRASRDSIDDGPPGVNYVFIPPPSSYPPRYGNYDSTPSFSRSYSDRGRRNTLVYDDLATHNASPYSSSACPSPWEKVTDDSWRPRDDSSGWEEHEATERQSYYGENSYRSNDDHVRHHHHSWR